METKTIATCFFWVRCLQNKRGSANQADVFSRTPRPHHHVGRKILTQRPTTNPGLFCSTLHSAIWIVLSTLCWGEGGMAEAVHVTSVWLFSTSTVYACFCVIGVVPLIVFRPADAQGPAEKVGRGRVNPPSSSSIRPFDEARSMRVIFLILGGMGEVIW